MMGENGLFKLPKRWAYTNLGRVLNRLSNGITHKQGTEGIQVTRIETISKGRIDLERVGYLENISKETILKYRLLPGDILLSHINSDAHLGKTAIFRSPDVLLLHGMNLLLVRVNPNAINSDYLNYILNYYRFSGVFFSIAQHAVNQSSINQAKLNNLPIPLPPFPEQHRIVAKIEELFTRLDAGVNALKKIKLQLKRYRQSVLKSAFEGKLTAEWREAHKNELEPASVLLEKIKAERKKTLGSKYKELSPLDTSELPELPEGWMWTRLGDITNVVDKVNPQTKPDEEFLYLDIASIDNNKQTIIYPKKYLGKEAPSRAKQCVKAGDVLFSTVRTYLRNIAVVDEIYNGKIASTGFCVIRPNHMTQTKFIFYWVQTDTFLNPLTELQKEQVTPR